MARPRPLACRMRASISILSIWCARNTCCTVSGTRSGLVVLLGPDMQRLAQVAPGQGDHFTRHGGGEQHGLPLGRGALEDPLHVGQEPEVEHLVRLVEHQGAHRGQLQVALPDQVEQPAGGADHDVHAAAQRVDLRLVGPAAVDGEHPGAQRHAGYPQVVGDLAGQLPGGHHDERRRGGRLAGRGVGQVLQQRDAEGQRLAGAGAGLADDVVPGQRDRQGQALDGERGGDAHALQGDADPLVYAKVTKGLRCVHVRRTGCRAVVRRGFCYG